MVIKASRSWELLVSYAGRDFVENSSSGRDKDS